MAATQRPVTYAALAEPTTAAAWRSLPSYFVYGSEDLNIPPAVLAFMAERAQARETRVLEGASHAVMVSHPTEVARVIIDAARAR
jgi:pimeloyl-ACP methyl ester carboxylesterase